jgi:hypothetical protein
MVTKKKSAVKKAEWRGYHKVSISLDDERLFDAWASANPVDWSWLNHYADQGYKISFSFDDYHQGMSASMYCTQEKMDWAGYTLSAWGEDAESAFQLLLYKHIVMCGEVWDVSSNVSERSYAKRG